MKDEEYEKMSKARAERIYASGFFRRPTDEEIKSLVEFTKAMIKWKEENSDKR